MKTFKQFLAERQSNYTVRLDDIKAVWQDINTKLFEDELNTPKFTLEDDLNYLAPEEKRPSEHAYILGYTDHDSSGVVLRFCKRIENPREMIEVVAHEMVHQALAERYGYDEMLRVGHGPRFMRYGVLLKKYHNIVLSRTLGDD